MDFKRDWPTLSFCAGKMIAVGGYGPPNRLVEVLDLSDPSAWHIGAPMQTNRSIHGSATIGDRLFVAGGQGTRCCVLSAVECYDSDADVWQSLASMSTRRTGLAMAELDGQIYAVGGWNGSIYLTSGERYVPALDQWNPIAPMAYDEGCFGLVSLGNCLYAIGGLNDRAKGCERYDRSEDRWYPMPEMNSRKRNASAANLGGRLFVIGDSSPRTDPNRTISAELFDPVANRWQMAALPPISSARGALAWFPGFGS